MIRPIYITERTETTITVGANCPCCGKSHHIVINVSPTDFAMGVAKWYQGAYIQDALYMLNRDEREFILTNICNKCNEMIYGDM